MRVNFDTRQVVKERNFFVLVLGSEEDTLYQSSTSPLQIIESFLEALTNADKDGRVVVNKQGEKLCFNRCSCSSCPKHGLSGYCLSLVSVECSHQEYLYFLLVHHNIYPLAFNLPMSIG